MMSITNLYPPLSTHNRDLVLHLGIISDQVKFIKYISVVNIVKLKENFEIRQI